MEHNRVFQYMLWFEYAMSPTGSRTETWSQLIMLFWEVEETLGGRA
jgi:hypothetical protein